MSPEKQFPKINLYRNISITFIFLTVILLLAIFLFFYNQASIIIESEPQDMSLSFNVEVKASPTADEINEEDIVAGALIETEKTKEATFDVLSTKTASSEFVGKVKIVNNFTRNQPLLETTQLQADNGVIVRTSKQVVVPAGGYVIVDVYPKDPDNFTDIEPGQLTIIKLNASLQDNIYGVTEAVLTNELRDIHVLAESDINRAKDELTQQLTREISSELGLGEGEKLALQTVDYSVDQKVGAEIDSFKLKLTVSAKKLEIDNNQLVALIQKKIANFDTNGLTIESIDVTDLDYLILDESLIDSVLVKINYVVHAKLDENSPILAKSNFVGRSVGEVEDYLYGNDQIKDFKIQLSPYWSKSFPQNENKISIIIK
ncbi:MAG TPA: hypothetical protein VJB67_00945 [Patescibacteria group bacterium]|nr:hypothetical protein [Patescibacteria group bacterium]